MKLQETSDTRASSAILFPTIDAFHVHVRDGNEEQKILCMVDRGTAQTRAICTRTTSLKARINIGVADD